MEETNKDYYKILGVPEEADEATIKNAYRNLSKKYHPDMNENKTQEEKLEAEAKFKDASEAYAILSNPEKRSQYDLQKIVPENPKADMTAFASSILEGIFEDMFKPYGGENTLKSNEKAYDNFVIFYKRSEKELNSMGFTLKNYKKYTDISCKGNISSEFYRKLESNIRKMLFNLPKDLKAYDEYLEFLNSLQIELNKYNRSVSSVIKKLEGKRGKISASIIEKERRGLIREFENIKKNAAAFDEFQEFYKNISEQYTILFNRSFTNIEEYINPKNRCRYTPAIFNSIRRQMQNLFDKDKNEREEKLKNLTAQLPKRNLRLASDKVSMKDIERMLDALKLMDEIDLYLKPLGITIEDYLETRGKTLEDVKHNELEIICATLKENVFSNEEEFEKVPEETIHPIR